LPDNVRIPTVGPGVADVSSEEVTNLNAAIVAAQQVQRIMLAFRTADATAVDLPGDLANGLDVDVTRLPAVALDAGSLAALETTELGAATLAALENVTVTVTNPGSGQATETTLAAVLAAVDGLEGFTDGIEGLLSTIGGYVDGLEANTAGLAKTDVATTLTDGRKTVTAPGTAVALRASLACKWVTVTALSSNAQQVNVGGSGVLAAAGTATGTALDAGTGVTLPVDDAAKVFVDARVAGEGVSFTVGS